MERRSILGIVIAVGVVVLLVAFALFRPDKLFVDEVVEEELDEEVIAALEGNTTTTVAAEDPDNSAPDTSEQVSSPATDPPGPTVVAQGSWTPLDHPGTGQVAIIADGPASTLVFTDLMTDNGPDLYVYLSPAEVAPGADYIAGAVRIERLKGNVGTQTYDLPGDLDLSQFRSAVIWCDRFSSGFTAAPLTPA